MARVGRIALLVLARWTFIFLVWPMRQDVVGASFMHLIDLVFHEAGHIVFRPFGEFLTVLGGSLLQVIVPIVCWISFTTTNPDPFAASVMAWWTGESLVDISFYANDARSLSIMLLGGHTGSEVYGHDWEQILGMTGLTMHDHQIAWTFHGVGAVMMVGALAYGAYVAWSGGSGGSSGSGRSGGSGLSRRSREAAKADGLGRTGSPIYLPPAPDRDSVGAGPGGHEPR